METDCFNFCQSDYQSSSFTIFEAMKRSGELVDFQVVIQNRSFFGHRLVLASRIPYLRTMMANTVTEIPIEGVDPDVFEDVINFAYSGKIKISMGNIQSLLAASQFLQLTQVHEACVKFISMQLNVNNIFQVRVFAGNIRSLRLAAACDSCILRNFEAFAAQKPTEFFQLPFPYLKEILSRDDLNVTNEEKVFEAAIRWVEACPVERKDLFPELLCSVRMTHLDTRYLVENVSAQQLVLASSPCIQLVEQTKNYHLVHRKSLMAPDATARNSGGKALYAFCSSELGKFLELYDAEKSVWITLTKVTGKATENVVGFNGKLYFLGNRAKKVETFDLKTFQWMPSGIDVDYLISTESIEKAILHDKMLYIFTGERIYGLDPIQKKWLGLKAIIDCQASGIASLGQYIYITGGDRHYSGTNVSKRYNPTLEKHNDISPMLEKRKNHGCAALNDKVYVCGGNYSLKSEVYDPLIDQWSYISSPKTAAYVNRSIWSYISSPKTAAYVTSLASYKGKLYYLSNHVAEIYDPENGEWTVDDSVPSCCRLQEYVTFEEEQKGCPEFSDLRVQLQMGFSLGLNVSATYRKSS